MHRNTVVIISGGPGSGQTTIIKKLADRYPGQVGRIVTVTTRPPRGDERHGREHLFYSEPVFQGLVKRGSLVEHVKINAAYYGTPLDGLVRGLEISNVTFLNIDVRGHRHLRTIMPYPLTRDNLFSIFINASFEQRCRRLVADGEDAMSVDRRLGESLERESAAAPEYDRRVDNDDGCLEVALDDIARILGL